MKKLITLLLAVLIMTGTVVTTVSAATVENEIAPYYVALTSKSAQLVKQSSELGSCRAHFKTDGNYKINVTMQAQRNDGGSWTTVATWYAEGTSYVSLAQPRYFTPNKEYRVYAVATIYDTNGNYVETVTAASYSVSF